jgi:glycosyltransferase involved in cell wall biosynthesis
LSGFAHRLAGLFHYRHVDYVFIQREASPIGPPIFEWLYAKLLRKKIIYDFDDAIWIPNTTEGNKLAGYVKCYWKVKWICKWAYKVSVGNEFLAAYARRYNKNVVYNPTCVDMENRYNKVAALNHHPPVIGWTGSHSTIQFLAEGIPALQKLEQKETFRFVAICDRKPEFSLRSLEFSKWNTHTEIDDLTRLDIGIMPLKTDAWSEGKCGFKLIQYMSLGIPALASPVGVNSQIIDHGINGYLCHTDEDWVTYLSELLHNTEKRLAFGRHGREKMQKEFSVQSNAANFLSLFS